MQLPPSLWPAVYRTVSAGPWPPQSSEDAERFVRAAVGNGLVSLLLVAEDLPPVVAAARESVRALDRANRIRTQLTASGLQRVAAILGGENIILLKGADYAFRIYPEPHLRQMADIDFLIPRERNQEVQRLLRAAGFEQDFLSGPASRVDSYHETLFRGGGVTIEPHHAFLQRVRHAVDYDAIWTRRVPFEVNGIHTWRLEDGDAILYAALSLASNEFDVLMIRYLDFYFLLDRFGADFATLAARARAWRMERAFYTALHQVTVVFPELLARLETVMETLLTPRRRRFLIRRVIPSPFARRPLSRSGQLWRKYQLMDGYRQRIGFLLYHFAASALGAFRLFVTHRTKSVAPGAID